MTELILPTDPIEIARSFAADIIIDSVVESSQMAIEQHNLRAVNDLQYIAALSGFINKPYRVDSKTLLLIPSDTVEDDEVIAEPIDEVVFEGRFSYYRTLRATLWKGKAAVNGLYLAFDNAVTIPFSERLSGNTVHVPVFDVDKIDRLSA